jgi:hypothetical protein
MAQAGETIGYQRFYLVKDGNWISKTRKTIVELRFEGHNLDLEREWPLLACLSLGKLNEDVVSLLECFVHQTEVMFVFLKWRFVTDSKLTMHGLESVDRSDRPVSRSHHQQPHSITESH